MIALLLGFASHLALASEMTKPYLMASFGDSLTAATMTTTLPTTYYQNKLTYSWASGQKIQSHYLLLKKYLKSQDLDADLEVLNAAIPNTGVKSLVTQMDDLEKELAKGKYEGLLYVTMLSGNNDCCGPDPAGTPPDVFYGHYKEALKRLDRIASRFPAKTHVLVSSFARIPDILSPKVRAFHIRPLVTCEFLQLKVLHYCDLMLDWHSEKEREGKIQITLDKNAMIEKAVEEAKTELSHLDIYYSSMVMNQEILPEDLAVDCFHPNISAQQKLSLELWRELPWFH